LVLHVQPRKVQVFNGTALYHTVTRGTNPVRRFRAPLHPGGYRASQQS